MPCERFWHVSVFQRLEKSALESGWVKEAQEHLSTRRLDSHLGPFLALVSPSVFSLAFIYYSVKSSH